MKTTRKNEYCQRCQEKSKKLSTKIRKRLALQRYSSK